MNSQALSSRIIIVAAIDGTAASDDVVRTSARLSQALPGAELHLCHVVEPFVGPETLPTLPELLERARTFIDETNAKAREQFSGRIFAHIPVGTPWREILQLGVDLHADLMVVGSTRKKAVERWLLGSVSEAVVRKASCAVLIARPKEEQASSVPEIEPPCPDCLRTQAAGGAALWCARHDHSSKHAHGRLHYELPRTFAVGSMLLRPDA